ncbi:MAG: DUF4136 domain-containing protein [Gammaproteobacteria bacterium]|nr:MAG: DUF4136 domain-containing protein [Gammaproteobacteria bacterium]
MRVLNLIFISFVLTACASSVNIDYDKSTNFTSFTSFSIDKKPVRTSADTRINSPFMQQRVVNELRQRLTDKGYENLNKKSELKVKYYLDIKHEIETQDSGVAIGFGTSSYHSAVGLGFNIPIGETTSIDLLVLTIDIVSAKTGKLLWRGSLGYNLYEGATPETYSRLINGLVTEIMENFPPK